MKNGTLWTDTDGNSIQAHSGCILNHQGVWYWYGENKRGATRQGRLNRVDFIGFSCYSSTDLRHWKWEGLALAGDTEKGHPLSPECVGERPVVLYNRKTKKFVMWFHHDDADYMQARIGLAISETPTGPFVYQGSVRPLGHDSRDMNAAVDAEGNACLFCSSDWNATMRVFALDDTYTRLTGVSKDILIDQGREAPAVFYSQPCYYMLSSACTGWAPNTMLFARAEQLMGSWRLLGDPCEGPNAKTTFDGQSAHAFCHEGQWFVLLDHWNPQDLESSGYSILPILEENGALRICWRDTWEGIPTGK